MPEKHRFPMRKYRLTREALQADPSLQQFIEVRVVMPPPPAGFLAWGWFPFMHDGTRA